MGESILAPSVVEDEMKGSLNNKGSDLEVSVSFGRFESDSLSWEKWSSFSPNKYLDEVEKCATPGSVAQKKAYFEAHYKKIAARKMEEIEQEKQKEAQILDKDDKIGDDHVEKPCEYDDQSENINISQKKSNFDESTIDSQCSIIDEIVDCQSSMIDGNNKELSKVEEPVLVQEETQANGTQKKAYSEAHYKNIAAHKVEEMEREKQKVVNFSNKDDQNGEDHVEKPYVYDDQAKNINRFENNSNCEESNESSTITINSHCSVIDEIVDSRSSMMDEVSHLVHEESQVIEVEEKMELQQVISEERVHSNETQGKVESLMKLEKKIGKTLVQAKGKMNLDVSKKSTKMAHSDKERSLAATNKKFGQRLPKKIPEVSTPKTPKPASVSSVTAPRSSTNYLPKTLKPNSSSSLATTSSSSTKKTHSSVLPRSKTVAETKKITPSSQHTSLSMGPSKDDSPSLPTNRPSLIMEKMADKDIVKRAFKSFQKNFSQEKSSLRPHSSGHNEVSTSSADRKVSSALTLQKGLGRGVGKMDVQRGQLGRSLNSTLGGSLKGVSMDQRHAKPAPSSSGIKSDERQKYISKKLVEQSSAKEVERARLGSKSKEKEAEIKNLRQSANFKATPMPSFYRGRTSSKLIQ